jgi:surface antigen
MTGARPDRTCGRAAALAVAVGLAGTLAAATVGAPLAVARGVPATVRPATGGAVAAALPVGSSLTTSTDLVTTSGYKLVMQPDGNLVESGLGRVLWSSRTHVAGSYAVAQTDGNVVIYAPDHIPQWSSHTHVAQSSGLVLGADGDLAVTSATGQVLWDDQVGPSRLAPTGRLTSTQVISSPDGGTTLTMGPDGNVVLRTLVGTAWVPIWASNTSGNPGAFLRMRADGDLVVLDRDNALLWSSGTETPGPVHVSVENGGNVRIYDPASDLVASLGDDYPAALRDAPQDSLVDPWGYYNRECVSFAAWRTLETDHVTVYYAGSAYQWAGYAKRHGYLVDTNPTPGSVAWTNAGPYGHVAMVEDVLGPYLVVEEYNYETPGVYSHRVVLATAFKKFLHFELPPAATGPTMSATVGPGATIGLG